MRSAGHDTFSFPGTFNMCSSDGAVARARGGLHWFPKFTVDSSMSGSRGWHFWCYLLGTNLAFFAPMLLRRHGHDAPGSINHSKDTGWAISCVVQLRRRPIGIQLPALCLKFEGAARDARRRPQYVGCDHLEWPASRRPSATISIHSASESRVPSGRTASLPQGNRTSRRSKEVLITRGSDAPRRT